VLERFVAPFLESLKNRRYAQVSVNTCKAAATGFAIYLAGRIRNLRAMTLGHLEAFVEVRARLYLATHRRDHLDAHKYGLRTALWHLIDYLHETGHKTGVRFPEKKKPKILPAHATLLEEFERFLLKDRGLAERTVHIYRDHTWKLCLYATEQTLSRWEDLSPKFLFDFLAAQCRSAGHSRARNMIAVSVRSFLRFLRGRGLIKNDAAAWLMTPANWALGRVVRSVPLSELTVLFRDVRGPSQAEIRDRLILTLLAAYGLRIGDIARLTFQDIRWREGVIVVRQEKTGTPLTLPLHPVVARVLLEYVREARPKGTPYREILLTFQCPQPYPTGGSLGKTLGRRIRRLGLKVHPHMFRHMVATRLINNGCPPAWIQILLGHKNSQTTAIYSKVDMAHLKEVAENDGADL
jgi:site-specific recombinase XerD